MQSLLEKLRVPDIQKLVLRLVLGFIFFISGFKIAFPADAAALATSYSNPDTGWISPFFVDWINNTLGLDVATFLFYQGLFEMLLGALLIFGFFTTLTAIGMGTFYWAITVANPVVGEIRLSRDITLMIFSYGLAYYGPGRYSIDQAFAWLYREGHESVLQFCLRFGLGFTFVFSALFSGGVMSNMLNSTIPVVLVFIVGALLLLNIKTKYVAAFVVVWLGYAIITTMLDKETLFKMLDGTKREMAFLLGALLLYAMEKRDAILTHTWVLPYR